MNGRATTIPEVLQAGTAVLVDALGVPRARCYCGNPLTAAVPLASPHYYGSAWPGYAPGQITIIERSVTIIRTFTLYDPDTGELFRRPAGTDGSVAAGAGTGAGSASGGPGGGPVSRPAAPPGARRSSGGG